MKTKSQMLFGGPSVAEQLILANQAAMMTTIAAICDRLQLGRYSQPLDLLAVKTHEYLKRNAENDKP